MLSEPETNPYMAPQSVTVAAVAERPRATKLAKTGAWLQLLPLGGIGWMVIGMASAFSTLTRDGPGDPAKLSAAIGEILIASSFGFWGGMVGCVLLLLAVLVQRNQPGWVKIIFWLSLLPALFGATMLLLAISSLLSGGAD